MFVFPDWIIGYANAVTLLLVGNLSESNHIPRLALFTNGIVLSVHSLINLNGGFFGSGIVGALVSLYTLVGFCSGSIGMVKYYNKNSLPEIYYQLNYFLYRSTTVGGFILITGVLQYHL